MVTRREFIQASALLGGVAIGGNSFGPLRFPGKDSAAINPIVTTALGKLRGRYANGVYSFKGVHYGASTEGRLRFRPPVHAKPWMGIRDAYEVGPPAPQVLGYGGFWAGLSGPGRMSEDCLVLNVWTPGLRAQEKRPVLVWLHGGDYGVGSGGAALYVGRIWLPSTMSSFRPSIIASTSSAISICTNCAGTDSQIQAMRACSISCSLSNGSATISRSSAAILPT